MRNWDHTLDPTAADLLQSSGNTKEMNPYLETLEEIDDFLRVFSDPYKEHVKAQPTPEPALCVPVMASGESCQQGSSRRQGLPPSRPTGMSPGSCDIPGSVLAQNSATPPDEDLEAMLHDLLESFDQESQVTSHEQVQPTAGSQNIHVMGTPKTTLPDGQKANTSASKVTVWQGGSQMQNLRCDQSLHGIRMSTLCGGQMKTLHDNHTLSGTQVTVPSSHQIFYSGATATPITAQSLYLKQMTNTWNSQRFNGDQMVTFSNSQSPSGGYQLVAAAHPDLLHLPGSPLIREQLPEKDGNLQTKSCPLLKKSESLKPYVCPHQDCGKSYWRSAYLKVHQRTHSGQKPYACNVQGCKWRFNRSDELKRHMRRHTGERPYMCEICKKSFSRSDHVAQHQRVHT